MKKKPDAKKVSATATAKAKPDALTPLVAEVRNLIQSARRGVASVVDTFQVMTNFEIGRRIVEHEQKGAKRAEYGKELLGELSLRLSDEFGKGFSVSNLQLMRKFFLSYQGRIQQQPTVKLSLPAKSLQSADRLGIQKEPPVELISLGIALQPTGQLMGEEITAQPIRKSPFTLSWTHYVLLLTIKDPAARSFYEIEATNAGWSVPELKRQKASSLYERLALSRDKDGIKRLAKEGQLITKPEDLLKEPLVLEFLGLDERARYSESDLESAIITHLEKFLLELGKGFLLEARQKRFTFDGDHYFLDLVFYNRLLRCYLVIDLKLEKLTHQDLGQMQIYPVRYELPLRLCPPKSRRRKSLRRLHKRSETPTRRAPCRCGAFYKEATPSGASLLRSLSKPGRRHKTREVSQNCLGKTLHQNATWRLSHGVNVNYYDRHVKLAEENPTIGLLLCREKNDAVVKLTLPKDANIHAKEYQLYLPSKELLQTKLLEWTREAEAKA